MAKSSYPKTLEDRAKLYLHCMVEIKERMELVQVTLAAPFAPLFRAEICSLQFRHICELIAIACLAAQGDFQTQRAFRDEYSPAKIFAALKQLYPDFFPQATTIKVTDNGDNLHHHFDMNKKPNAYRESDIVKLWNRSGNDLHRASVKKYLKTTFGPAPSLSPPASHLDGIAALLNSHIIPIGTPPASVYLDVRMTDGDGNVLASFLNLDREGSTATIQNFRAKMADK